MRDYLVSALVLRSSLFNRIITLLLICLTSPFARWYADALLFRMSALSKSFEERYFDDEAAVELFDDTVLSGTDDLSEVTASTVDKAAIAVDLTTNSLTDFKVDTESLTTLTQNDKVKK